MKASPRIAAGALALALLGLLLSGSATWLAFGIDFATLEYLRRDLPFGWLIARGMPIAATCLGVLATAAWIGAWWLQSRVSAP